ncbi:MAG: cytochrome C oxidase subunit IV family protein [Bacteroidetes bacterium]|nr:cytochrome C oxidase subunit IV family protein [Bacteroidota bacterium]
MNHSITNQPPGKAFPDEQDYHGHPNYGKIFLSLLVLMGASLVVGYFTSPMIGVSLIFLVALIKAGLVVGNFMHLKFEPILILVVVLVVVFILASFFWGVFPDITLITRDVVK